MTAYLKSMTMAWTYMRPFCSALIPKSAFSSAVVFLSS